VARLFVAETVLGRIAIYSIYLLNVGQKKLQIQLENTTGFVLT
jgi:hypothetical protein